MEQRKPLAQKPNTQVPTQVVTLPEPSYPTTVIRLQSFNPRNHDDLEEQLKEDFKTSDINDEPVERIKAAQSANFETLQDSAIKVIHENGVLKYINDGLKINLDICE